MPEVEKVYINKDKVPLVFHQLWKTKDIPDKWENAHQRCINLNPEYKLIIWDDAMIYNFIAKEYPWFYRVFISYPYHIQRVDVARYFILYHYGGVYLDIDARCRTPFRQIIANMTNEKSTLLPMTDIYGVTNSFMISKRRSDFFKYVIYELPSYAHGTFNIVRHTTVIFSTGPMFLSHCVTTFESPNDIYVMSIEDYDMRHFYHAKGGSWHGMDTEIVDAFHFHYIQVLLIAAAVILLILLKVFKKDFFCCCTAKVKYWLGLGNSRSAGKEMK